MTASFRGSRIIVRTAAPRRNPSAMPHGRQPRQPYVPQVRLDQAAHVRFVAAHQVGEGAGVVVADLAGEAGEIVGVGQHGSSPAWARVGGRISNPSVPPRATIRTDWKSVRRL